MLSRLGHCETYDFGLELETALAKALDVAASWLEKCGTAMAVVARRTCWTHQMVM